MKRSTINFVLSIGALVELSLSWFNSLYFWFCSSCKEEKKTIKYTIYLLIKKNKNNYQEKELVKNVLSFSCLYFHAFNKNSKYWSYICSIFRFFFLICQKKKGFNLGKLNLKKHPPFNVAQKLPKNWTNNHNCLPSSK